MKKSRTAPPWRFCDLHNRRTGLGEEAIPEEETAGVRQKTFIAAGGADRERPEHRSKRKNVERARRRQELRLREMDVDHRRLGTRVPPQLLEFRDAAAILEQMCRETVAHRVWMDLLSDPRILRCTTDDGGDAPRTVMAAVLTGKEPRISICPSKHGAKRSEKPFRDEERSILVALAVTHQE